VDSLNPTYSTLDGVLLNKDHTVLLDYPRGRPGNYTTPASVISIAPNAFFGSPYGTSLTGITISEGVTSVGDWAFGYSFNLTNITLASSITNLGHFVFAYCTKLGGVTIPNGVSGISGAAFDYCTHLTNVVLSQSVQEINTVAFRGCYSLTSAYFEGDAPIAPLDVFNGATNAIIYYLPGTSGWGSTFAGRPTALWLPRADTSSATFGVRANQFGFEVFWANDRAVVIEACTNFSNPAWAPLATNTIAGNRYYFADPGWTNHASGFYRIRSQ
jgi:hypothetical protein